MDGSDTVAKWFHNGTNVVVVHVGRRSSSQSGNFLLKVFEGCLVMRPGGFLDGKECIKFCTQVCASVPDVQLVTKITELKVKGSMGVIPDVTFSVLNGEGFGIRREQILDLFVK